jgi:hypothetical protein
MTRHADLPTDDDLRTMLRGRVPGHLDHFWDDLDASLDGRRRPRPRGRAWTVPLAVAASVAAVVAGTALVRVAADPEPAARPAGPPAPAAPAPASQAPDHPGVLDGWDDLEPRTEYSFLGDVPDAFRPPPVAPGDVTGTAFFVDDAGRHALVLSVETSVLSSGGSQRVVSVASHATLATLGESGWVVVTRVTDRVDPSCERPRARVERPYTDWSAGAYDVDGDGTVDRPPLSDRDRDGTDEVSVALVAQCGDGDLQIRYLVVDGRDVYELRGAVDPDFRFADGPVPAPSPSWAPPPRPTAVPAAGRWPADLYEQAVRAYDSWFASVE